MHRSWKTRRQSVLTATSAQAIGIFLFLSLAGLAVSTPSGTVDSFAQGEPVFAGHDRDAVNIAVSASYLSIDSASDGHTASDQPGSSNPSLSESVRRDNVPLLEFETDFPAVFSSQEELTEQRVLPNVLQVTASGLTVSQKQVRPFLMASHKSSNRVRLLGPISKTQQT